MPWLLLPLVLLLMGAPSAAQPADDASGPSLRPDALGFEFSDTFLRDLPLSDSVYPLLETVQPSLILDRFTNGGLYLGRPARVGGFQASWSQTRFLVGDVDVSDPNGTGAPLLFPDLGPWQRVRVATGLIGSQTNTTGLALDLVPRTATGTWQHTVGVSASHGGLTFKPPVGAQPAIAALEGRDRVSWIAGGPLRPGLRSSLAASWTRTTQYDRAEPVPPEATLASMLASVVADAAGGSRLETVGWLQTARAPLEYRHAFGAPAATARETGLHLQSTWHTPRGRRWPARLFAGYSQRSRTPDPIGSAATVERLVDGPIWGVLSSPRGTVRQGTAGARAEGTPRWRGRTHAVTGGVDLVVASQHTPVSTVQTIGELTDGEPSRVWSFRNPTVPSRRGSLLFAAHASDTVRLTGRLTASAGLRVESVTGAADGAADGITWRSLLPRARLDWRLRERGSTTAFVGFTRSAARLSLDLLAYGDPAAPWAAVYRWDPRFGPVPGVTSLVARVGPGTGGVTDFVRIDSHLRRPISDELSFGVEARPSPRTRWQIAAVGRRERHFMTLLDVGAPTAAYTVATVTDPGANTGSPDDDKVIPVYSRRVESFGVDRYVLTNPGLKAAYSGSLEISGQHATSRLTFYGGATASIARGPAAALGYGPLENDQSVVTDTYVSPNADGFRRGRLFNDRAFTIKLSAVYALPWQIRAGAIARYQDGQNFSRLLVFPGLPQGTEAVRAFAAGDSRFRFIAALDVRLSKGIAIGGRRLDAVLDGYNLTGQHYDVEERAAQAPNVRTPTAYQPPRVFHLGARITF